jgi:hypothetical protein
MDSGKLHADFVDYQLMHLAHEHHMITLAYQHGSSSQRWIAVKYFLITVKPGTLAVMTLKMHYILYCTKIHTVFKKISGLYPRAPFKREGKTGREGKGKRERAVGKEVIRMNGKS